MRLEAWFGGDGEIDLMDEVDYLRVGLVEEGSSATHIQEGVVFKSLDFLSQLAVFFD